MECKIAEEEGGGTCKKFDEFYKFDIKVNRPNQYIVQNYVKN